MPKTTTIDHTSVLQMALVGYEMQRNRIEAAIAEIQAELGQGGSSRSISTAKPEQDIPRKRHFSAAARKRMAAAQKKRWQLLKAKKAPAKKTQPTVFAKRQKATAAAPARKRPVQVKAAKPKARKTTPKIRKAVVKPQVQEPDPQVQTTVESAPPEATV
jgi:hypothetical protein